MTNRLKSIHVQPLLVISFLTISKIAGTQKTKTKTKQTNKQTNKLMSLVAYDFLKNIIYFVTMPHIHCAERIVKQKKCNILYKFVIQNKL